MAATAFTIDAETSVGSIDLLTQAIDARTTYLKETTSDACVAASITILRSLKSATPKARTGKVDAAAYEIKLTDLWGGLCRQKGEPRSAPAKICARVGSPRGPRSPIRPAIGFKPGSVPVTQTRVYAIYTTNPNDTFAKNVNAPAQCWYVLCADESQAVAFAQNHIKRILSKESGMAKYALGIAQARASNHSNLIPLEDAVKDGNMSEKAVTTAYNAGVLQVDQSGFANGAVSVSFLDKLNYSSDAAGGEAALTAAIDKASKSMLGYIEKVSGLYFDNIHSTTPPNRSTIPFT